MHRFIRNNDEIRVAGFAEGLGVRETIRRITRQDDDGVSGFWRLGIYEEHTGERKPYGQPDQDQQDEDEAPQGSG